MPRQNKNWQRAMRDVVVDGLCITLLFVGYEAFFDHYRLLSSWTGTNVQVLADAALKAARARLTPPRVETAQKNNPAPPPTAPTVPPPTVAPSIGELAPMPVQQSMLRNYTPTIVSIPDDGGKVEKPPSRRHKPQPVKFEKRTVNGVPLYLATIDLQDPQQYIEIALPHDADQANTQTETHGDEDFQAMLKRHPCALAINGTFFAKDDYKCVMGNMVSGG